MCVLFCLCKVGILVEMKAAKNGRLEVEIENEVEVEVKVKVKVKDDGRS